MTLTRTLWDILDSREGDPSIVDSQDPEVEGAYFQNKRSRLRWRVGITSAIALGGAMVLVVVGSVFWRNATPAVQEIASPAAAIAVAVTDSPCTNPRATWSALSHGARVAVSAPTQWRYIYIYKYIYIYIYIYI